MILSDGALAIYIAAGLAAFLVLLWCVAMFICKGPCRSLDEPVKSPFDMYMDPAIRNNELRNKYDLYHYSLMTPRTPIERHQVMAPAPLTQASPQGVFDFGAVLRTHAMEKEHAQSDDHRPKAPLIKRDGSDSSSNSSKEPKKITSITVDLHSENHQGDVEEMHQPLTMQSTV